VCWPAASAAAPPAAPFKKLRRAIEIFLDFPMVLPYSGDMSFEPNCGKYSKRRKAGDKESEDKEAEGRRQRAEGIEPFDSAGRFRNLWLSDPGPSARRSGGVASCTAAGPVASLVRDCGRGLLRAGCAFGPDEC